MKKLTKEEVNNMSSKDAYLYCLKVEDREEVWNRIINSFWAYFYCKYIKDRKEVRKHIKN